MEHTEVMNWITFGGLLIIFMSMIFTSRKNHAKPSVKCCQKPDSSDKPKRKSDREIDSSFVDLLRTTMSIQKSQEEIKKLKNNLDSTNEVLDLLCRTLGCTKTQIKNKVKNLKVMEDCFLDKPGDRLWHESDNTWWKKVDGMLVSASAPANYVFMGFQGEKILAGDNISLTRDEDNNVIISSLDPETACWKRISRIGSDITISSGMR